MLHALTVDVEDWPQSSFDYDLPITERALRNTHTMLELFSRHGVRGTFFILGLLADKFPKLVTEIESAGHEIGSHGYSHRPVFQIGPEAFTDEIRRSRQQLEDLTGKPVSGYRAPDFSITKDSLWALDILADQGFVYDSSIFPVRMRRYGISEVPRTIHRLPSGLIEVPMSTVMFAGRRWPVAGGGYLRLIPGWMTSRAIRQLEHEGLPSIVYLHPYEIDPGEFHEIGLQVPWKTRITQGLNRSRIAARLEVLFQQFQFAPLRDVIDSAVASRIPQATAESYLATAAR